MNSVKRNPWHACLRPNPGAGTRLVLFPYAGAGPPAFGAWSKELNGLAVELAGVPELLALLLLVLHADFEARHLPGDHFFIHTARTAIIAFLADELISAYAKD